MPTSTGPGVLQGLAVLITGGGSGIGRATAVAATAAGARVLVCGRRESTLREVADLCGAYTFTADLNEHGEPDRVVSETVRRLGRIDGVVLNAGVMLPGSVLELTDQAWDACVATNLSAPFRVARAALPHLVATRGALVGVSSVAALRSPTHAAAYASSKAGLSMLMSSIAVDFGPAGVRSNVVCSGWVRTEMADEEMTGFGAPIGLSMDDAYGAVTQLVPQRRPAEAHEVAAAVVWLLSPLSSYVNGATLSVDGGVSMVDAGTVPLEFAVTSRAADHPAPPHREHGADDDRNL